MRGSLFSQEEKMRRYLCYFAIAMIVMVGPLAVTGLAETAKLEKFIAEPTYVPPRPGCPTEGNIVEITGSSDIVVRRRLMMRLPVLLGQDGVIIRLGPDVNLDFSERLPNGSEPRVDFPINFGRCVTLTSVDHLGPINGQLRGPITIRPYRVSGTPMVGGVTGVGSVKEARSAKSPGPILKYGKKTGIFFEIRCFVDGQNNDGARISGFRLIGPSYGQQSDKQFGVRIDRCLDVEISNMEIAGWGGDGIVIQDDDHAPNSSGPLGRITHSDQVKIHDNYFHHNQHPSTGGFACVGGSAEGYGVGVGHGAWARIYRNVFDFNRHSIAADGDTGGYIAERNLVLKGGGYHGTTCNTYTHNFDVHGTGCSWSSDLCGNAGLQFSYVDNAFQYTRDNNIKIRGVVGIQAFFNGNIFPHSDRDDAINLYSDQRVTFGADNHYEVDSYGRYAMCDFDGDAIDDLFLPTGASWWYSSYGEFQWTFLGAKKERIKQLEWGYFDNDQRCDLLSEQNGQWMISSGGTGDWKPFGQFGVRLGDVDFGRFDPSVRDNRPGVTRQTTHAFRRGPDGQWYVHPLNVSPVTAAQWQPVQSSQVPANQLRLGDFTGDGVTDVLAVDNGRWSISESGVGQWRRLNPTLGAPLRDVIIANMDRNDNIDDILRMDQAVTINNGTRRTVIRWYRSRNGADPWVLWKTYVFNASAYAEAIPVFGYAGRFGAAPGGGTLTIDPERKGRFYSAAETAPDWESLYWY